MRYVCLYFCVLYSVHITTAFSHLLDEPGGDLWRHGFHHDQHQQYGHWTSDETRQQGTTHLIGYYIQGDRLVTMYDSIALFMHHVYGHIVYSLFIMYDSIAWLLYCYNHAVVLRSSYLFTLCTK